MIVDPDLQDPAPQDPPKPATTGFDPQNPPDWAVAAYQQASPPAAKDAEQEPLPDWMLKSFEQASKKDENDFLEVLGFATETHPDLFAEAQAMAKSMGADPQTVYENKDVLRATWVKRMAELADLEKVSPQLAQSLRDVTFAKLAHDDWQKLGLIEGMTRSFTAGRKQVELGAAGIRRMTEGDTPEVMREIRNIRRDLYNLPSEGGFLWGTATWMGQMSEMMPQAVKAGSVAGSVAGTASFLAGPASPVATPAAFVGGFVSGATAELLEQNWKVEAGISYDQLLRAGYNVADARFAAHVVGWSSTALEAAGTVANIGRPLLGPIKAALMREASTAFAERTVGRAAWEVAKSYGLGIAAEGSAEGLTEVVSVLAEDWAAKRATNPNAEPSSLMKGEAWDRIVEATKAGAQVAAVLGALPEFAHWQHEMANAKRAEATHKFLTQAVTAAGESKLVKRAPDEASKHFARVFKDNPDAENVYLDGQTLRRVFEQGDKESAAAGKYEKSQAEQFVELFPQAKQVLEQPGKEGDIVVPAAEFVAGLGRRVDLADKILPHARVAADEPSLAQIQEAREKAPEELAKLDIKIQKRIEDEEKFAESAARVEQRIWQEIRASAPITVSDAEVAAGATMARRFYEQAGEAAQKLPEELPQIKFVTEEAAPPAGALNSPRGYFDPNRLAVVLREKADVSTVLHELSHGFFHLSLDMAAQPDAPQMQSLVQSAFDHFGVKDRAAWDALGFDGQKKHQENLAYNFELWLHEGKAPTLALQRLFERMAAWMRRVYRDITGSLNDQYKAQFGTDLPALTPELRSVFDRMLASEDHIAQTEAVRGRMALFQDRASFPGTDEEWAEWRALLAAEREGGIQKLSQVMLKDLAWLGRETRRLEREMQEEIKAKRKTAAEEARKEVEQRPVYRLRAEAKKDKTIRLNRAQLQKVLGADAAAGLEQLKGLHRDDGLDLDFLAEFFGFQSGELMVRALRESPPIAAATLTRTDEIMLRDHSQLATIEGRKLALEEALNTEASSRLVAASIRWLAGAQRPNGATVAAARELARQRLLETNVEDISARDYSVAAAKAGREAAQLLAGKRASQSKQKGAPKETAVKIPARPPKPREAIDALHRQLVLQEMARQAVVIERDLAKAKRFFARVFANDDRTAKNRNFDLVLAARAILSTWGYGTGTKMPEEHLALVKEHNPEAYARLEPILRQSTEGWDKGMSWGEFQDMHDAVKSLWETSKRASMVAADGKLELRAAVVDVLLSQVATTLGVGGPLGPIGPKQRAAMQMHGLAAMATRVEHWLRQADGGKADGPWQKWLFRPMREAFDRYMADRSRYVKQMSAELHKLRTSGLLDGGSIVAEGLNADGSAVVFEDMNHLLGALLHHGNLSNLRKLLVGYGWGADVVDPGTGEAFLDSRRWDDFLAQQMANGRLRKEHLDFVQRMWDMNAQLKPLSQKVNREAFGRYFDEVKPRTFSTPWGEYAGGYAPATPDPLLNPDLVEVVDKDDPLGAMERDFSMNWPTPPRGFTITRNESTRKLKLDLKTQVQHFDQALRFIHLQLPMRDALGLLNDAKVSAALNSLSPNIRKDMFMPWLKAVATNRVTAEGLNSTVSHVLHFFRRSVGLAFMALNVTNALQQFTGIINGSVYVPRQHLWTALRRLTSEGPTVMRDRIIAQSPAMAVRFQEHFGLTMADLDVTMDPSKWAALRSRVDAIGYALQSETQHATDIVVWQGAFDHAIAQGRTDAQAVQDADSVVRLSQGSRTSIDTAKVERGGPGAQFLLQFGSYYLTVANQILGAQAGSKIKTAVLAMMLPTFVAAAIATAMRAAKGQNDFEDKDEDGSSWDDFAWWLVKPQMRATANLIPIAGPVLAQFVTAGSNPYYADRVTFAPIEAPIRAAFTAKARVLDAIDRWRQGKPQTDYTAREFSDDLLLFSFLSGIPLTPLGDVAKTVGAYSEK